MTDKNDVSFTVVNNQSELIQSLVIRDEAIRTLERVIMRVTIHLKRSLQGLAA